ncbi:MAG: (Fe-S)-binding protein [Methylotenera sp.]|uniref:(Fe-S)-binding protein n=1 Tax=Methylotenera sp. TaxID=2051956 RepID=UPI0024875F6B|nr:(Fe-S)-binding protein [Methylotenera sp.]MDI1310154.1 (Fe-S)-binding protein [Methylotenera sp.]
MTLSIKELIVEADRCVACGLCLPHCPTYRKTGSEADSPRGRIQLMRAVAQEILPNNTRFNEHIDLCLSCRSCESACPNNVNYGALVDTTRALFIPKKSPFSALTKVFIRSRFLTNALVWKIWLIQKTGLFSLIKRIIPVAKLLPMVEKPSAWKSLYPANSEKKGAVSLFLGCAGNALDTTTLKASIQVLNQLGYDVHIPAQQTCCGGIARQMGDAEESSKLVAQNQNSFDASLPILTTASGCGAGLNDYLPTHKIQDISAFLMACDWSNVEVNPLQEQIYVQDPCTLRNVQKSHQAVYSLLKKIPDATIIPLAGNSQCCGGAGAYMLTQSEMANNLLKDKLNAISANNVAILATSNIGCSLHIANGLREKNLSVSVMHPIQIIAKQMRASEQV